MNCNYFCIIILRLNMIFYTYNHIFHKQGFDWLCQASKFAEKLKDDHNWFNQLPTKITLQNMHQRYVQLYHYSSNVNKTVWKLHKIIQNISYPLEEYLKMKLKGLSNLDVLRTPHILLKTVFLINKFYGFSFKIFIKETVEVNSLLILYSFLLQFSRKIVFERNSV